VFVQLWPQPLITAGGPQLFSQALRVCGARNVFAELPRPSATVAREAVLARQPRLIVAADPDPAALSAWRTLAGLQARLSLLDPALLPRMGIDVLDGVAQLCQVVETARTSTGQAQGVTQ